MIFKKAPFILICTMLICLNAKGMDFLDEDIINEYCPELNFEDESSFENKFGLGNNELNYDTLPDLQDLQNPLELQYQQNPEELEYLKDTFKDTPINSLDNFNNLGVYDDQTEYDLDFPYGVNLLDDDNFLEYDLNFLDGVLLDDDNFLNDDLYDQMDLANQAIENIENNNPKDSQKNNKLKKPREKRSQCKFEYTGKIYKNDKTPIYFCPFCEYSGQKYDIINHIKSPKHNLPNYNHSTFDHNAPHTTKNANGTYTCNLCKKTFNTKIEIIKHLIEHHKITVKKLKTTIENIPNIIENNKIKTPKPYKPLEKRSQCKFEYTGKVYKNNKTPIYFCPFCEHLGEKSNIIKHIKSSKHNLPNYNYSTFDHNAHHTIKNPDNSYTCNLCKKTFNNKIEIIKHLLEHHKITLKKLKTNIKNIPNIIKNNKRKKKNILPATLKPLIPIIAIDKRKKKQNTPNNNTYKLVKTGIKSTGKRDKFEKLICHCPFCNHQAPSVDVYKHIKGKKSHAFPDFNYKTFKVNAQHTTKNSNGTNICNLCKKTFDTETKIIKHLLEHHKITVKKLKTTIENIPNIIENNKIKAPTPRKPRKPRKPRINWNNISNKIEKKNGKNHALCPFCPKLMQYFTLKKHITQRIHNLPNFDFYNFNKNDYHMVKNTNNTFDCKLCNKKNIAQFKILEHLCNSKKENGHNIDKAKIKIQYQKKILPATFKPIVPVIAMNKTNKKRKVNTIYPQDGFTQSENPNENRPRKKRRF